MLSDSRHGVCLFYLRGKCRDSRPFAFLVGGGTGSSDGEVDRVDAVRAPSCEGRRSDNGAVLCGLDLGRGRVALAVYDYARKCAVPLEIDSSKTMPACVAVEAEQADVIIGKRAEGRSAKKCQGVLCAYRSLFGMHEEWHALRSVCDQQWHSVAEADCSLTKENGEQRQGKAERLRSAYTVKSNGKDKEVSVADVVRHLVAVACSTLREAAPGGVLQVAEGEQVEWLNLAVAVPECLSESRRSVIADAVAAVASAGLGAEAGRKSRRGTRNGAGRAGERAAGTGTAVCSIPPFAPKAFLSVDLGASKLSVALFELQVCTCVYVRSVCVCVCARARTRASGS